MYERLVGLVKQTLRKSIGRLLTLEELVTVASKCEGVLNSRPLTYVGSELENGIVSYSWASARY